MTAHRQTVFDDILDLTLARDEARRPTLVRVIVDGFVRDDGPRSAREIKQLEELLLHLLPMVDPFTRAVAAQKLAGRADVPRSVIARLANDDAAIAEPILAHSPLVDAAMIDKAIARGDETARRAVARRTDLEPRHRAALLSIGDPFVSAILSRNRPAAPPVPEAAADLPPEPLRTERRPPRPPSFLDAPAGLRRALLSRLSATPIVATVGDVPDDAARLLVRLAVLRQREAFVGQLARLLGLTPSFTRRVTDDPDGEPLVVAARVLDISEDMFAQLLVLADPAIGHNTDKVLELRKLHRSTTREAAATILATWRSEARDSASHRPVAAPARPGTSSSTVVRAPFSAPTRGTRSSDG